LIGYFFRNPLHRQTNRQTDEQTDQYITTIIGEGSLINTSATQSKNV